MASFNKLSVNGIRSFCADTTRSNVGSQNEQIEDQQAIIFEKPLTIITGPNGSGKTTIIECLNFITTGESPYGRQGLQYFISDPKIFDTRRVDAVVRLEFTDTSGKNCVVSRRLSASVKQKKVDCRTEECTIMRPGLDGREHRMTTKIQDTDAEMCNLLGVSKAILNNVIFCHQEQSNWPLSDPKELKKRFDEIFAATRYVKALDAIKKVIQKLKGEIGKKDKDVYYLKEKRDAKIKLMRERVKTENELSAFREEIKVLEEKLAPLERQITEIDEKTADYHRIKEELGSLRSRASVLKENVERYNSSVVTPYKGDYRQLKAELDRFESEHRDPTAEKIQCDERLESLGSEKRDLVSRKQENLIRIARLEDCLKDQIEKKNRLKDVIVELGASYSIEVDPSIPLGEHYLRSTFHKFETYLQKLRQNRDAKEKELYEEEEHINAIKANRLSKVSLLENRLVEEGSKAKQFLAQISECDRRLSQIESSHSRIRALDEQVASLERLLTEKQQELNPTAVLEQIDHCKYKRDLLDNQIHELNGELKVAQMNEKSRTELQIFKSSRDEKKALIDRIINGCEPCFGGAAVRVESFKDMAEKRKAEVLREKQELQDKKMAKTLEKGKIKGELERLTESLASKENFVAEKSALLEKTIGVADFSSHLEGVENGLFDALKCQGGCSAKRAVFTGFVEKLDGARRCCPLCERKFNAKHDAENLAEKVRREMEQMRLESESSEQRVDQWKRQRNELDQVRPLIREVERTSKDEIPSAKRTMEQTAQKLENCADQLAEVEKEVAVATNSETMNQLSTATVQIESLRGELNKMEHQIEMLQSDLKKRPSRALDEVQTDLDASSAERQHLTHRIDSDTEELNSYRGAVNQMEGQLSLLRSQRLTLKEAQQESLNVQERLAAAKTSLDNSQRLISETNKELRSARSRIDEIERKLAALRQGKEHFSRETARIADAQRSLDKAEHLKKQLEESEEEKATAELEKAKRETKSVENADAELQQRISQVEQRRQAVLDEIKNREQSVRNLRDNLHLMEETSKLDDVTKEIDKLVGAVGFDADSRTFESRRRHLAHEKTELKGRLDRLQGKVQKTADLVSDQDRQLSIDFKDVEEQLKTAHIELITNKEAAKDLEKYHKALDAAIISYHSDKMNTINQLLKDYWNKVYNGGDIDCLEIKSEETSEKSDRRKAYNYRVVMRCAGREVDMRNRCSAGQKVLASILIRLALADVFCINCGMLALDEPTTNLDVDKSSIVEHVVQMESLAEKLVELVAMRRSQSNFQLVVITHEDRFVDHLYRFCRPEHIYSVEKEPSSGRSLLKRHSNMADNSSSQPTDAAAATGGAYRKRRRDRRDEEDDVEFDSLVG